ncbi:acyltransferase [Brasilonema sp. UFV-L1]|nr:acyltransferase [Brasilonema sp. UFV-L1]
MVQLDSLRALAVFGVLVHHFLPPELFLNSKLHWGPLGVRFFFVLSGFLITGILLRCRDLVDFAQQDAWFTIRRFYVRRFLRLIPVYYLTIFVTTIIAFQSLSKFSLLWHLTYTSNIYYSWRNWDELTSHFWSLSVEEQFYFIWPLFIIFIPKKRLLTVIFITIFLGPLFRFIMTEAGLNNGVREYIFTISCFDSLGMGALLAFCNYNQDKLKRAKKYLCNFCFWIGIPLFVISHFIHIPNLDNSIIIVWGSTAASMFFVWLIERAARGFSGWIGVILELPALVYLGKISYGIYVYHILVGYTLSKILTYFGLPALGLGWKKFFLSTVATLIVASLSWQFFEKPINALKRNFGYKKEALITTQQ